MHDNRNKENTPKKQIINNGADAVYIKSISVLQAAEYLHCTLPTARILLKQGKIRGQKIRGIWYIDVQSVEEYANQALYMSTEIEIDGERARQISDIAKERRRDSSNYSKAIHDGKLNGHFINGKWYVTDSEMERYDNMVAKGHKPFLTISQVAEKMGTTTLHVNHLVEVNRLRGFTVKGYKYVYEEDLERYMNSGQWKNPFDFDDEEIENHKKQRRKRAVYKKKKIPKRIIPSTFRRKNND